MMIAAFTALLMQSAAAPTPIAASVERDLQCVAIYASFVSVSEGQKRSAGTSIMSYFWGRVEAAAPQTDMLAHLTRIGQDKPTLIKNVSRCQAEALAMGERMMSIGKALSAKGI